MRYKIGQYIKVKNQIAKAVHHDDETMFYTLEVLFGSTVVYNSFHLCSMKDVVVATEEDIRAYLDDVTKGMPA